MSPKSLMTLRDAAKYVGDAKQQGVEPEQIIGTMIERFGAKRTLRAAGNTLRCGGVTGSCTSSKDAGLLNAWFRNATIKIAMERMA